MRDKFKKFFKEESGIYIIEAIYVVFTMILIIFFTFNVAIVFYNRQVAVAAADQAASGVAQIYGERSKEPFVNFTDYDYFKTKSAYRYLFRDELMDMAEEKAKWYASYLIYDREFAAKHSKDFSDIEVKIQKNDLNVDVITVRIKREYPVFELNPVKYWGLDPKYEVEAIGTAVCYDVIHDMNTTSFKNEICDKIDGDSTIISMINDVIKLVQTCQKYQKGKDAKAAAAAAAASSGD